MNYGQIFNKSKKLFHYCRWMTFLDMTKSKVTTASLNLMSKTCAGVALNSYWQGCKVNTKIQIIIKIKLRTDVKRYTD
jgi:hypothetical protein